MLQEAPRTNPRQTLSDIGVKCYPEKPRFSLNALVLLALFFQSECSQHVASVQPTNIVVSKIVMILSNYTRFIAIIK